MGGVGVVEVYDRRHRFRPHGDYAVQQDARLYPHKHETPKEAARRLIEECGPVVARSVVWGRLQAADLNPGRRLHWLAVQRHLDD